MMMMQHGATSQYIISRRSYYVCAYIVQPFLAQICCCAFPKTMQFNLLARNSCRGIQPVFQHPTRSFPGNPQTICLASSRCCIEPSTCPSWTPCDAVTCTLVVTAMRPRPWRLCASLGGATTLSVPTHAFAPMVVRTCAPPTTCFASAIATRTAGIRGAKQSAEQGPEAGQVARDDADVAFDDGPDGEAARVPESIARAPVVGHEAGS